MSSWASEDGAVRLVASVDNEYEIAHSRSIDGRIRALYAGRTKEDLNHGRHPQKPKCRSRRGCLDARPHFDSDDMSYLDL